MDNQCKKTMTACFIAYITQAIVTNFVPLLYLDFQRNHNVELYKITIIIAVEFLVQLLVDLIASKYAARIGYRLCLVSAHIFCAAGFILMTILPTFFGFFQGVFISVIIYAIGAGLLEVLVSPVVESCPTKNKAGIMSFLHSFYCWGVVATVLLSTIFLSIFGVKSWRILICIWAVVPLCNAFLFSKVKLYPMDTGEKGENNYKKLFVQKNFWIMLVLMFCAGACEQALSQWGSTLAGTCLNISKTAGDLLVVCGFAFMMGLSRLIYAKFSKKLSLRFAILFCAILCAVSFVVIGISKSLVATIIGFALCGFSIGIFWPGTFSFASKNVRDSGTTMFALLALAGDIGCVGGPSLVGGVSNVFNLKIGVLMTTIFPLMMIVALLLFKGKITKLIHSNKT